MDRTDDADPQPARPAADPRRPERAEPGEARRALERPPAERYLEQERATAAQAEGAAAGPGTRSPLPTALAIGAGGAVVVALLGGPLSMTAGLVAAAAFIGWLVAAVGRPGRVAAVAIAVAAVGLGLVGIWLYARLEGGSLGIVDYLLQVHGPLVPLHFGAAAIAAAGASR